MYVLRNILVLIFITSVASVPGEPPDAEQARLHFIDCGKQIVSNPGYVFSQEEIDHLCLTAKKLSDLEEKEKSKEQSDPLAREIVLTQQEMVAVLAKLLSKEYKCCRDLCDDSITSNILSRPHYVGELTTKLIELGKRQNAKRELAASD